jgi:glycine betaine/proline transport system ATP-binding protein
MVNGLLTPTAGSMVIGDQDVARLSAKELRALRRNRISMVFQHFALFPHRTVGENAAYGLEVKGLSRPERERAATEALTLVGLEGWGASLPGELSGGMRQRVGLARALATGADIMLMDEAFSALDPLIRREMQDQLVEIQSRLGTTIVFITHDLNEAMRLGDRIAMMRDGRIVQVGTAEQILNDPANDYVARFTQDVDRSRVLTATSVMEPPVALLGAEQGPARPTSSCERTSSARCSWSTGPSGWSASCTRPTWPEPSRPAPSWTSPPGESPRPSPGTRWWRSCSPTRPRAPCRSPSSTTGAGWWASSPA